MTLATLPLRPAATEAAGRRLAGADPASGSGVPADRAGAGPTLLGARAGGVSVVVSGCSRHFRRSRLTWLISGAGPWLSSSSPSGPAGGRREAVRLTDAGRRSYGVAWWVRGVGVGAMTAGRGRRLEDRLASLAVWIRVDGVVWGADTRVTAVRVTEGSWLDARTRRVLQAAVRLVRAGGPDGRGSRGLARDLRRESWISILRAERGSGGAYFRVTLGVLATGRRGDARGRRVGRQARR